MKNSLRIGIVGAGSIVRQRHWPGLREIAGVRITAVTNSTPASSQAFLAETDLHAEITSSWQDLITHKNVDIVWIGTHPNLHEPIAVAALEAGKHVFCQARMARNLAEAQHMFAVSESHPHLVTMLCPPPYGLRQDAFIRQLLGNQIVGDIRKIHLESLNGAFLDPAAPAHWRQRREISGCNVMTLGIYIEVLQRWFGHIAWVEATGEVVTPMRENYHVEIPEKLTVTAHFASKMPARLDFSNVHTGKPTEALTIFGSAGTLTLDFSAETIVLKLDQKPPEVLPTHPELDRPWRVERDFIEAVRNPHAHRPHPSFLDGVAYMRVVEAVDEARLSESRKTLKIPN